MTRVDELKARLVDPMPTDRLWGWLGPGLIALLGGFVRFWNLGQPHALVFDETYYVKEAWSLLKYGVEMQTEAEI
jgi:dolichyl-phosphate-mannose-protein mannosyltransferase